MFQAAADDLVDDAEIQNQAANNDEATFRDHVFPERYLKALLGRRDRDSDLIYTYLDSDDLQAQVMDVFAVDVQRRAIVARQRTCPIGDLLGRDRESLFLEYKSTLRCDIQQQRKGGAPEDATVKTVAGFANSQFGGTLLIGVADDGTVHGLEDDYATFSKRGQRGDQDLWGQHLQNLIRSRLGDAELALATWEFHTVNGQQLARISIDPSNHPIHDRSNARQTLKLKQSDQARQARRVRLHQLRQLPHQSPALRRQTQLGAARHPHPDLKREEPEMYPSTYSVRRNRGQRHRPATGWTPGPPR